MAINFTFYRVEEKKPDNYEDIIWLKHNNYAGYEGFNPREITVEYTWLELDENGEETGNQCCYSEGDGETLENHKLAILFDGYIAQPDYLWCSVEDYWKALDTEIEIKENK